MSIPRHYFLMLAIPKEILTGPCSNFVHNYFSITNCERNNFQSLSLLFQKYESDIKS